ncbi:MAG TPA: ABC transporter ATP-binding protein, partial [Acidimicrobiales bacterium]|nr:ABC transporter ATP-binding protein [Acidimicrobiales bacterium]
MTALLTAEGISVRYGGVRALDGVSIAVEPGEILGLIGANGAGKTTLFECIAGFNRPVAGTITFDGHDITAATPEHRARLGLIRSFQDARLFESLTVFQTLLVAQEKRRPSALLADVAGLPGTRRTERAKAAAADELLATMGLTAYRDRLVAELSTGTRRITELACVLALEPRLLLLDEPSSGIAQREVEALGALLRRIKETTGCTMLVIEHDMPLVMGMADRIVALESGRFLAEGTPAEIQVHPGVIASYLGSTAETIHRSGTAPSSAATSPAPVPARRPPARPRRTAPRGA